MTELNLIGTTLARFEILKELGRGGMAVVYQARQTDLDRVVALKVLPPALTHDASYVARFRQEARSAARLEHPHIMPIYEVGEANGLHYIAMKYIAGQTVKELVEQEGSLPVQRAATILAQVGDALDYAHKQGVIHRDIKPSNMMITEEGWVYLTDFGLARGSGASTAGLTMAGTVMGTPEYMSPEQAQGLPNIGPATDIYALGVVLYELLTGAFPFNADTPMGMLAARLLQAPIPPRDVRGDLPPTVEDVVMRALARKPEARFPNAAAMVAALRAAAGIGSTEPPRPATPMAGTPAIGATLIERPSPAQPGASVPPSNPPYVRQANQTPANLPASALPPLSASAPTVPPGAVPRKGPKTLTVILGALGVVILGCIGLFVLTMRKDTPLSDPTVVSNTEVELLIKQGDAALGGAKGLEAALGAYRKALDLDPGNPLLLTKLALATNASGDWPTSETYANQLIDAPTSSKRQLALGYALLADAYFSQGDLLAALKESDTAISNDTTNALAHAIQSTVLAKRALASNSPSEMDIALASVDQAVDAPGTQEPLEQALVHNALGYTFSQEYQLSGNTSSLDQSKEQYQQALAAMPNVGLFQANLASLLVDQKQYAQAREGFDKALVAGYTPAQAAIGWVYVLEKQPSAAEQAFDAAIALAPASPDGYYGKGRLRCDEQKYDEAITLFNEALQHNQRSAEIQGWLGEAYFWKGFHGQSSTEQKDAFAQAAAAYRTAITQDDRSVFALSGLAWTLQHQQEYSESVAQFDRALALNPTSADNHQGRGWSLFNLDRFQEAESAFREALKHDEKHIDAHFHLGRTLEKLERKDEARKEYQRVLELDPQNSAAQDALNRLGA